MVNQNMQRRTPSRRTRKQLLALTLPAFALFAGAPAWADPAPSQDMGQLLNTLDEQKAKLAEQERLLKQQMKQLEEQKQSLQQQQQQIDSLRQQFSTIGTGPAATAAAAPATLNTRTATAPIGDRLLNVLRGTGDPTGSVQTADQQPVGKPEEGARPQVSAIQDVGGVLTPRGVLTVEPSLEYDNSQTNQFFFAGTEIVNAVFIGGLEATNARHNTITAALNGRYGITNRLEANVRVPYVYRSDRESQGVDTNTLANTVHGHDIGDIEFGAHYQINNPQNGGAYYVGNLRVKSDSGTNPFEVPFNALGQQTRLPTGTGAWAFEPSLTVLYPSDPVVLYGNVGYAKSLSFNPNVTVPTLGTVTNVEPGDTLRGSFGMGFGINDRVSMSLGYEHDWVQSTTTTINGLKQESEELQIGSLNLGVSYVFSPRVTINANVMVGATRDAPDARLLVSVPISFGINN
jgi:hypothetical protein